MKLYVVYREFNTDFNRFALSLTRDMDDAADLVQSSYLKALDRDEDFENMNEYQIKGWFFSTIKNMFIDNARRAKRYHEILSTLVSDDIYELKDDDCIEDFIEGLDDELKDILRKKFVLGLNSKEISEILGISPSTIRSRLSKAYGTLRRQIIPMHRN